MDIEQTTLKNLVDLNKLKLLFENFSSATGFTTCLVDNFTNKIIFGTGWREICGEFHRTCPESQKHCKASNKALISKLNNAGDICIHHCENGLVDGCTPVIIQGKHFATLFTGQLLFAPPDKELFRKQAQKYGYDEEAYLKCLAAVPIISEERFTALLHYFADMVSIIAEKSLVNLDTRKESNRKEALLQSIFKSAPVGIGFVVNRVLQWTNHKMSEICGYTSSELEGQEASMLYSSEEEFKRVGLIKYAQIKEKGTGCVDTRFKRKDGSIIDVQISSTPIDQQDLKGGITFTVLDITERKNTLAVIQENEQRLQVALEGADLGMWDWNIQTDEIYFSPGYFSMLGYGPTELPHTLQTWETLLHPEEKRSVKHNILTIIRKGQEKWSQEFRLKTKNGQYLWILGRGKIVDFSSDGTPLRAAGTHLDITSHKIAAEKLRDSEERFRELFNNMSSGVAIYTTVEKGNDFIFKDINKAGLLSSKIELIDILGKRVTKSFPGILDMGLLTVFQRVWKTGIPEHYPSALYQDKRIHQYVENYVYRIPSGEIVAIYKDITVHKQAKEELLRSKKEWERTFNAMPDIVTIQDKNFSIIRANQATCSTLDLPWKEIIGQHCFSLFHGSKEPCPDCPLLDTRETFLPYSREMYHERLGKTFLVSAAPVFDEQGQLEYITHVAKDITKLNKLEEDSVRLAAAINQAAETIVITDKDGTIQYVNPAFEKLTGYSREEAIGLNPRVLKSGKHDQKFYKSMWNKLLRGEIWKGHLVNKRKNESLFEEEVTISPVKSKEGMITNFVAVKRDVTRERSLEKQLRQAMKMEAIGTLAGGIAHDFNNILTAMIGFSEIAREQLPTDDPIRKDLDQVLIAGDRAAELVQQILTFSRQGEEELRPVKLQIIVKEVLKLLRSSLPTTISLSVSIDAGCGMVLADPTQIHQVLMNLFTNAKHAIGEELGTISVALSEKQITEAETNKNCPQITSGTYLHLTISDTGCGMDGITRSKIFDPFYTTKDKEKGTGLGLAVVHGIIKQHKGEITAASKPGHGTTFHICLPIINPREAQAEQIIFEDLPLGKGERILFVDDEPAVAEIMPRILENLGYVVTAFTSSIEALNAFQSNPGDYDLVITDMTMPEMTGMRLAGKLLTSQPDLPIILCTGFNETIDESKAKALGIREYIIKPVDKYTLAKAIIKALKP